MQTDYHINELRNRFEKLHQLRDRIKVASLGEDPQMQKEWNFALGKVEVEIRKCREQIIQTYKKDANVRRDDTERKAASA